VHLRRVALLLLLAFALFVTPATIAFSVSTPVSFPTLRNIVSNGESWIEPLGDPIGGPGFPH